jgi:ATP-dependent Clp protease ATP-binding subunit ClpA
MLRRLSPKSQQIIDQAQVIARRYEQEYVDTEHVLLAIAEKNDNRATRALEQCGASADKIRKKVEKFVKKGQQEIFVLGRLPATLHFKNVIARALEIAEKRGAAAIEPEHLLLSLSAEDGSLASQALGSLGVDTAKLEGALPAGK